MTPVILNARLRFGLIILAVLAGLLVMFAVVWGGSGHSLKGREIRPSAGLTEPKDRELKPAEIHGRCGELCNSCRGEVCPAVDEHFNKTGHCSRGIPECPNDREKCPRGGLKRAAGGIYECHYTGKWVCYSCNHYDGLGCGQMCSTCDPDDVACYFGGEKEYCNEDGKCVAEIPVCGD